AAGGRVDALAALEDNPGDASGLPRPATVERIRADNPGARLGRLPPTRVLAPPGQEGAGLFALGAGGPAPAAGGAGPTARGAGRAVGGHPPRRDDVRDCVGPLSAGRGRRAVG